MFGNDGFGNIEDLFNQISNRGGQGQIRKNTSSNLLNTIEMRKTSYFIFDVSGRSNVSVEVKDELEVDDYGEEFHTGSKILEITSTKGAPLKFILPKGLKRSSLEYNTSNGILEVTFRK